MSTSIADVMQTMRADARATIDAMVAAGDPRVVRRKPRVDRQATLHTPGDELPLRLPDGWVFDGSCLLEIHGVLRLVARWKRVLQ